MLPEFHHQAGMLPGHHSCSPSANDLLHPDAQRGHGRFRFGCCEEVRTDWRVYGRVQVRGGRLFSLCDSWLISKKQSIRGGGASVFFSVRNKNHRNREPYEFKCNFGNFRGVGWGHVPLWECGSGRTIMRTSSGLSLNRKLPNSIICQVFVLSSPFQPEWSIQLPFHAISALTKRGLHFYEAPKKRWMLLRCIGICATKRVTKHQGRWIEYHS